jgi:hypothetical protein
MIPEYIVDYKGDHSPIGTDTSRRV